jgi:16S rRNA (cytosine967-C5)-methyltransferase
VAAAVTPTRWVALETLRALRAGELLDPAFARWAQPLSPRDRAWTQELVYGTQRLRGRMDTLLARFLKQPIATLEDDVLDILRLGAYQLLEMHGVPAYAAVSQSVELTKSVSGRGATGLVNGVLQSLRRAGDLQQPPTDDSVDTLSSWGSHPAWLVGRWLRYFGAHDTRALVDHNNRRPELFLRLLGVQADDAIQRLRADGMTAEPIEDLPEGIRLIDGNLVRALELVPAVVQDPAAMLVVRFAEFSTEPVADLCAAPGGKALAVAVGASDTPCYVLAADISWPRLEKIRENAERVGNHAERVAQQKIVFAIADARFPPVRRLPQVLIDAPCTGTGTLRRHPDGKWRLRPSDIEALVVLQRDILDAVAACVLPGGLLVYATCSLEPEENEDQVDGFLRRHPEFELEPPRRADEPWLSNGMLHVLPQRHGYDGAFAARLRKAA